MIIDTHAHIDVADYDEDRESVIERARESGVQYMLNIGCDIESSYRSMELAEQYDFIYATAGIHPHDVKSIDNGTYAHLRQLLTHPKMVALGEIGLDFFKNYSPQDLQRTHFHKQIELARDMGKPIVVHSRDAKKDIISILSDFYPKDPTAHSGIFHCFLDGHRNCTGFTTPHTNSAISISYYGQCRKAENSTPFDDLGNSSNVD